MGRKLPPSKPASSDPKTESGDLWEVVQLPPGRIGYPNVLYTLAATAPMVLALEDAPDWLKGQLRSLQEDHPITSGSASSRVDKGRPKLLHGLITDHPVYAALWHQPPEGSAELIVRRFQALFLTAVALDPGASFADYAATLREAGLCVRRICLDAGLRELANQALPAPITSLEAARLSISKHLENVPTTQKEAIRLLRGYARLISYAGLKSSPPARGGQPRASRHVRRATGDEPDAPFEAAEEFIDDELDSADVELRVGLGAAPVRETPARRNAAIPLEKGGSASGQARVIQAKTRARAMATTAQRLPFASDRLQLFDVECLAEWLQENESNKKEESAVSLLTAILLMGADIQRLRQIQVSPGIPGDDSSTVPRLIKAPLSWCLPTPILKEAFVPKPASQHLFRAPSRFLIFPLPKNFPGVTTLMNVTASQAGGHLFTGTERQLELEVQRALKVINQSKGSRLTVKRVAEFIERMVSDTTKDQADGAFFSTRENASGSAARLYYYCPSAETLVKTYIRIWQRIFRHTTLEWSWAPPLYPDTAVFVGSAGCPTDQAVTDMVTGLKKNIRILSRGRRGKARTIEFHNALTTYSSAFGMWSSALRAVHDPIEVELIDPITGFLGVSEKESDDFATSRVIPLVPVVLTQMNSYAQHRESLLTATDLYGLSIVPRTWLFYIEDEKPCPVTPARLKAHLGNNYPFPLNAQRHYIRTRLRELGVQGAFVDAFLGHGATGEEPYGRYSAISPMMLRRAIVGLLEDLLMDAGWEAVEGMR